MHQLENHSVHYSFNRFLIKCDHLQIILVNSYHYYYSKTYPDYLTTGRKLDIFSHFETKNDQFFNEMWSSFSDILVISDIWWIVSAEIELFPSKIDGFRCNFG